jgi:hypothetical protein
VLNRTRSLVGLANIAVLLAALVVRAEGPSRQHGVKQPAQEVGANESLIGLVEKRALVRFTHGDEHPTCRALNAAVDARLTFGDDFDRRIAESRLTQLISERVALRRRYGLEHPEMTLNAVRIHAVSAALIGQVK